MANYEVVFSSPKDFAEGIKKLTYRKSTYNNKFPYNCLYCYGNVDGKIIYSADCWNMIKAFIWCEGKIPTTANQYVFEPGKFGLGDWNGRQILDACFDKSSDFTNISPGEYLLLEGEDHAGIYVGDYYVQYDRNSDPCKVNVIECTGRWGGGIIATYVDTSGNRLQYKGGEQHRKWQYHAKLPWVEQSSQNNQEPTMLWPSAGSKYISQHFGEQLTGYNTEPHKGIDIGAALGTDVFAAADGKVIVAQSPYLGYGNCVRIDHGSNIQTLYAHLQNIYVKVGDIVSKGQVIATVGQSGNVTGPHLHFEVRVDCTVINNNGFGTPVDPEEWVSPQIFSSKTNKIGGGYFSNFNDPWSNPFGSPKGNDKDTVEKPKSYKDEYEAALNRSKELDEQRLSARQSFSSDVINAQPGAISKLKKVNLLATPTRVESPFIEARIGAYTFGSYSKVETKTANNTITNRKITYPNFMDSLEITKVNGAVNQYVLHMKYQIQAGEDPNLIDKVLSSVSDSRKIYLTYGDWNTPNFIYRDEEALITKVSSSVDFAHSCITYTLYCTSAALSLRSKTYDFGTRSGKPSSIIIELLKNTSYGLLDIFYGFRNEPDAIYRMIATDDKSVSIKAQRNIDIFSYLNYLVSCMISTSNGNTSLQNSMYSLVFKDDVSSDLGGPYFQVIRTDSASKSVSSSNMYEVDVGFPGDTLVTQFSLMNDNSWSILYNYSDVVTMDNYVYKIDNKGVLYTESSPNIMTSDTYKETTAANKTWWTKMTQFPITATLQIKGLLRPAMLMEYIKINAYFYGQRHISSGLYVITKQQDTLNSSGYRTTLSLLRIASDEDNLYSISQTSVNTNTNKTVDNGKVDRNAANKSKTFNTVSVPSKPVATKSGINGGTTVVPAPIKNNLNNYVNNNKNTMLNINSTALKSVNSNTVVSVNSAIKSGILNNAVAKTQTTPIKVNTYAGAASPSLSGGSAIISNVSVSKIKNMMVK